MKIIDPHLHLFDLNLGQYQWLRADKPPFWVDKPVIAKDFTEADLNLDNGLELDGFVHIEAGFDNEHSWRELAFLHKHVHTKFKAIACVDLLSSTQEVEQAIEACSRYPSFVGFRHILDEDAQSILNHPQAQGNLAKLAQNGLIFEVQMAAEDTKAVEALVAILQSHPDFRLAINHGGWPPIGLSDNEIAVEQWHNNLSRLAAFPNVVIKASGWEMLKRDYQKQWQLDVLNQLIDLFGVDRVLLASNFPLALFSMDYQTFWQQCWDIAGENRQALCCDNARQFYGL